MTKGDDAQGEAPEMVYEPALQATLLQLARMLRFKAEHVHIGLRAEGRELAVVPMDGMLRPFHELVKFRQCCVRAADVLEAGAGGSPSWLEQ